MTDQQHPEPPEDDTPLVLRNDFDRAQKHDDGEQDDDANYHECRHCNAFLEYLPPALSHGDNCSSICDIHGRDHFFRRCPPHPHG